MRRTFQFYQSQNLSLAGRITVVKMFVLPKFVHLLSILPSPKQPYLKEINACFSQFIWNNKRPIVAQNILVQDYIAGGQKIIHFPSFCKASKLSWLKKIYNTDCTNSWKIMLSQVFEEKQLRLIFEGSVTCISAKSRKIKNLFWKEVLDSWCFYREHILNIPYLVSYRSQLCGILL